MILGPWSTWSALVDSADQEREPLRGKELTAQSKRKDSFPFYFMTQDLTE